jgi:hypothetical protein
VCKDRLTMVQQQLAIVMERQDDKGEDHENLQAASA